MQRIICDIATRHWYWTGNLDSSGYGRFSLEKSHLKSGGHSRGTHRVAYTYFKGPIPEGMFVLHACDTPRCVSPDHLFLGTQTENMSDMIAKGRHVRGTGVANSRLTDDGVRTIRKQFANGMSVWTLATQYGISPRTMSDAITGLSWRHVD